MFDQVWYSCCMSKVFSEQENIRWSQSLPGKMTSACLAILRDDDKVLMVKASYKDDWTFPSGIVDSLESPAQAAVRETREETGLVFRASDCSLLGVVYTASDGRSRDRFNFGFYLRIDADSIPRLSIPNDEIENYEWVDLDDVTRMSGGRLSYGAFQSILVGSLPYSSYIEVGI